MDQYGSLATLRHGFKCYGRTLHAAYFKAAHELNPDLEARYAANRLGLTRQLRFSPRSEKSVDLALSLNGIPVATLELKNPLTGQRVEDARDQYKHNRDPREPIFQFKRRTLVHFAVDTESVLMTTRLASGATRFFRSTGVTTAAAETRQITTVAPTEQRTVGGSAPAGTACWISSPDSFTYRWTRNAMNTAVG